TPSPPRGPAPPRRRDPLAHRGLTVRPRAPRHERARLRRAPPRLRAAGGGALRAPGGSRVPPHAQLRTPLGAMVGVPAEHVTLFWRGRVAMYALLRALGVGPGDE